MPDHIIQQDTLSGYIEEMARYAIADNRRRMVPDIRDGLKPVQRRDIYSIAVLGATSEATKKKCARVVGDCMGKYHPHGDCISGGTIMHLLDGKPTTIEQLYKEGKPRRVLSVDPETGKVIPAIAHSFRIGQYTDKIYHIKLSNGYEIKCTGNHPFMLEAKCEWIKAEDIECGHLLFNRAINLSDNSVEIGVDLYVEDVYVEEVDKEPMYDFTVDGLENALIPIETDSKRPLMICAHNSSIYGALKPISNWWECKLPLVHIHGNSGNFQGEKMAAMRYTEAYLTEFSTEFMQMLKKYNSVVDWSPNFDNTTTEPDYLPFLIPILLINGASGIGTGMRMDIPPHNPKEVIKATRDLLKNPNADVVLVPDFCMPCDIIDTNWKQISHTGVGKFKARGHAHIGEYKKCPAIFITSLPQGVNSNSIKDKLNAMMQKGTINSIQNIYWEGDENNVNLVIQLKKGQSPEYLLDMIYKYTQLESSYSINFEAIYGIEHLRFSYKSYLELFIDTAKLTIFRMYQEKYQQVMTRYHQLDAYIKVIQSGEIDNIYKAIRKNKSGDLDELVQWLCKKLDITDLQAGYIIKSDLGKFSKGYLEKYLAESKECYENALEYQKIILDDGRIIQELDKILDYYDKKYCKPRICNIISESDTSNIPKGNFTLVITENNYIRKLPENATVNTVRKDYPNYIIKVDNQENILLFANTGKVYKLPIYKIPVTDKSAAGTDIRTLVKGLTSDICSVMYEPDILAASKLKRKHYMVVLSAGNSIKKLDLEDFLTVPPSGIIYTKLNEGDMVVDTRIVPDGMDVVVYSGHKALRMKMKDIPHYKRNTVGVLAMNAKDPIEGMDIMYDDITHIVVVTRNGKINRFVADGLIAGKRYQSGSSVIRLGARDNVVSIYGVNESNSIRIVTSSEIIDVPVSSITVGSSVSAGTKIPGIKSQDIVVKTKLIK